MTLPTNGSPINGASWGGELDALVLVDLVDGQVDPAERLTLADPNHRHVAAVEIAVGISAQHVALPAFLHTLIGADADRDQHIRALNLRMEDLAGHRIRLRVIAVRIVRIRVLDVGALRPLR